MNIRFFDADERSEVELLACEKSLGLRLPADFRRFVTAHDGASVDNNSFVVSDNMSCAINRFIPVARIREQSVLIENLANTRLPVAWAEGGNFVCLETAAQGGVFFWDHEEPSIEYRLADSFDGFIGQLRTAESASAAAPSATVKKAWIDQDFLDELNKR